MYHFFAKFYKLWLFKVIDKRRENIEAFDSKYYDLNEFNYDRIITDLVGIRLIINYRGKWLDVHRKILEMFPLLDQKLYEANPLLEHRTGERFQAEWPKVYYAQNDPIQEYKIRSTNCVPSSQPLLSDFIAILLFIDKPTSELPENIIRFLQLCDNFINTIYMLR